MLVPVSRITQFFCPLTHRMLLVNQLVYPNFLQMIARHIPRISLFGSRLTSESISLCHSQEANDLQTLVIESIHRTAHRIISQNPESREGVMSSEDFMRIFELESKFDIFHHRLLGCPKGFERRVQMLPFFYELQDGTAPFDALESYFVGPTVSDCGGVVEAVFMKAIADAVGEERFNALFSVPSMRFRLQNKGVLGVKSLLPLFTQTICPDFESRDLSRLKAGARLYFQGVPWSLAKRPLGAGSGLHAICMNDPSQEEPVFWGIGLKQFSTQQQILESLLKEYNTPRSDEERVLIDSIQGDCVSQLVGLNEHIGFYRKEVEACLTGPDHRLTLEDVREHMGFLGYEWVDVLAPEMLALIKSVSIEELKTERFVQTLALFQTAVTCQKIAELRSRVMG